MEFQVPIDINTIPEYDYQHLLGMINSLGLILTDVLKREFIEDVYTLYYTMVENYKNNVNETSWMQWGNLSAIYENYIEMFFEAKYIDIQIQFVDEPLISQLMAKFYEYTQKSFFYNYGYHIYLRYEVNYPSITYSQLFYLKLRTERYVDIRPDIIQYPNNVDIYIVITVRTPRGVVTMIDYELSKTFEAAKSDFQNILEVYRRPNIEDVISNLVDPTVNTDCSLDFMDRFGADVQLSLIKRHINFIGI